MTADARIQKLAPQKKGTVQFLNEREGVIGSNDGYRYTFQTKDADADVRLGSKVTFRMKFPQERNLLGVADSVAVDPCPPAAPEFVILVSGCKNAEKLS